MDEFSQAQLGDQRLTQRLGQLAVAFAHQPAASISAATGDWGQACAAYRFLDNDHVTSAAILATHAARTQQRAAGESVVLAVNDTTSLNYSDRPATTGLSPIGNHAHKGFGLLQHNLLAFTPTGQPLGVLDVAVWARDPAAFGANHQRNRKPVADKESAKWLRSYCALQAHAAATPQTRWVFVADREADLYDLFELATATPARPAVLVRLQHDRGLEQSEQRLFTQLARAPQAGQLQVAVPRRPGQAARTATVTIRFCAATLRAPLLKPGRPAQSVWAIAACEAHPPRGAVALHWRLLTTLPVPSLAAAVEKVGWYCVRWGIAVFHKVRKSGCAVEAAQLETAARLERYVLIKMVVAWRVLALTRLGLECPTAAITAILEEGEWQVLRAVATRGAVGTVGVPTVRAAVRWIGQLGGHLGRRGDGAPGPLSLARGLQRLADLTAGWKQAQATKGCA